VSQIVTDTLADLKMTYPKIGHKQRRELALIRRQLEK
jgi:hypothetical protein